MGKPSDHPDFKRLYAEWNRKLSDSGFDDIEEFKNGKLQIKRSGTVGRFEQEHPTVRKAKEQYYEIIGKKINSTVFEDEQERQILCLYQQGHTQAAIKKMLNPSPHRCTIYKKLYKWLKLWGLK